jgi:hypothetical protein
MTDPKIPAPEPVAWANHANLISAKIARERKGNVGASELHTWREGGPTDYHGAALITLESAQAWVAALEAAARQEERERIFAAAKSRADYEASAAAHHAGSWHAAHEHHMTRYSAMSDLIVAIRAG